MTIYKCDRCGAVIESEYDVMHFSIDNPEREKDKNGHTYSRPIKRDLCVDCAMAIIDVLDGSCVCIEGDRCENRDDRCR